MRGTGLDQSLMERNCFVNSPEIRTRHSRNTRSELKGLSRSTGVQQIQTQIAFLVSPMRSSVHDVARTRAENSRMSWRRALLSATAKPATIAARNRDVRIALAPSNTKKPRQDADASARAFITTRPPDPSRAPRNPTHSTLRLHQQ